MSLSCDIDDAEFYVAVPEELTTSPLRHKCLECRNEIAPFAPHYQVHEYRMGNASDVDEAGDSLEGREITIRHIACCEACGDLAASVLELGYCWSYGDLRNSIAEMREEEQRT